MKVVIRKPPAPLSDTIEMLWYCENPHPPSRRERVMPSGQMAVIINLVDDRLSAYDGDGRCQSMSGIAVAGALPTYKALDTAEQHRIMGVHFKPGGAAPFLGLPAGELFDRHLSLTDLWGAPAATLQQQLIEARTVDARFDLIERVLLARLARAPARQPVVAHALRCFERTPGIVGIAEVERTIALSPKRLIQLFRDEVGLTPKLYCRVRRFRRVLAEIERSRRIEWAGLAADCGYYDQAHFIRDFRAFSGWNPSAFLAIRGERINHIPLPEGSAS